MTALWTSAAIASATDGVAHGRWSVDGIAIDSREVEEGDLFIALRGANNDGHRFIPEAIAAGAAAVLCENRVDYPHVCVVDSYAALNALGAAARTRCAGRIVAVTGSAGKTGTKEALFWALHHHLAGGCLAGKVHRSLKSCNNHVGVPLSLARMPTSSAFGVFEMGMNHSGELAELTRLVRPHVAIVTTIAPAHKEFFACDADIADAKGEIFEGLQPGGYAILPFDNPHYDRLCAKAHYHGATIIGFGTDFGSDLVSQAATGHEDTKDNNADVCALDWLSDGVGGSLVTARVHDSMLCFRLGQSGEHWVSNAMAVLAAVGTLGGDLPAAGIALAEMNRLAGRGERHRIACNKGQFLLIDESYNANPASMAAAIRDFGKENCRQRLAILGSMHELGQGSERYHGELAEPLLQAGLAFAMLVGKEMTPLAKALKGRMDYVHVTASSLDSTNIRPLLDAKIAPGDALLIKGSNSLGLSRLVAELTAKGL